MRVGTHASVVNVTWGGVQYVRCERCENVVLQVRRWKRQMRLQPCSSDPMAAESVRVTESVQSAANIPSGAARFVDPFDLGVSLRMPRTLRMPGHF